MSQGLAPVRYVDDFNAPTEVYPMNPNGSPLGIAGTAQLYNTTLQSDRRHTTLRYNTTQHNTTLRHTAHSQTQHCHTDTSTQTIISPTFKIFNNPPYHTISPPSLPSPTPSLVTPSLPPSLSLPPVRSVQRGRSSPGHDAAPRAVRAHLAVAAPACRVEGALRHRGEAVRRPLAQAFPERQGLLRPHRGPGLTN